MHRQHRVLHDTHVLKLVVFVLRLALSSLYIHQLFPHLPLSDLDVLDSGLKVFNIFLDPSHRREVVLREFVDCDLCVVVAVHRSKELVYYPNQFGFRVRSESIVVFCLL